MSYITCHIYIPPIYTGDIRRRPLIPGRSAGLGTDTAVPTCTGLAAGMCHILII